MATLTQGQAIKLHLSASQTITVTPASNGRATVSANGPGNLSYPQKTIYSAETFGPYVADAEMVISAVAGSLEYTDPYTLVPSFSLDAANNVTGLVGPDGARIGIGAQHPAYKFAGFAGLQFADDPAFYDRSSNVAHGVFGANLNLAAAWGASGYVSTVDPVGGATDSVIRIPSISWDLSLDESLVLFWMGKVTAEGSAAAMIGDTGVNSTPGFQIVMQSTGKIGLWLSTGAGSWIYCGNSNVALGTGGLVSFALAVYGVDGTYQYLSNGAVDYLPTAIPAGNPATLTAATLNIGAGSPSPGGTAGIATATRAMAILKFASEVQPDAADVLATYTQWIASPDRLIELGAL